MSATSFSSSSIATWSRTVIGPLTTTFTPPAACSTGLLDCPDCVAAYLGYQCLGAGASNPNFIEDATTCWPPSSPGLPVPSIPLSGWGFYSPGLICPSGYISACAATAGGSSGWDVQFLMILGETAVGCCPSGFACARSGYQQCIGNATAGERIPLSECFWDRNAFASFTVPATFTPTVSAPTTTFTITQYEMIAPMIEIVWRSSDRTGTTTSITPAAATSATQATSTNAHSQSTTSGLSTGAKVALGVTIPVVFIGAIIAIFCYLQRRRPRCWQSQLDSYDVRPEHSSSRPLERDKQIQELEDITRAQEMENERVYEVEGTDLAEVHR